MKKLLALLLAATILLGTGACATIQQVGTTPVTQSATELTAPKTEPITEPVTEATTLPTTVPATSLTENAEEPIVIGNISFPNQEGYKIESSEGVYTVRLSDDSSFFDVYVNDAGDLEGDMLDALVYLRQAEFEDLAEDKTDEEAISINIAGFEAKGISFKSQKVFQNIISFTDGVNVYTIWYFAATINSTKRAEYISTYQDFLGTAEYIGN